MSFIHSLDPTTTKEESLSIGPEESILQSFLLPYGPVSSRLAGTGGTCWSHGCCWDVERAPSIPNICRQAVTSLRSYLPTLCDFPLFTLFTLFGLNARPEREMLAFCRCRLAFYLIGVIRGLADSIVAAQPIDARLILFCEGPNNIDSALKEA